jgi:hypothetical protein
MRNTNNQMVEKQAKLLHQKKLPINNASKSNQVHS